MLWRHQTMPTLDAGMPCAHQPNQVLPQIAAGLGIFSEQQHLCTFQVCWTRAARGQHVQHTPDPLNGVPQWQAASCRLRARTCQGSQLRCPSRRQPGRAGGEAGDMAWLSAWQRCASGPARGHSQ